MPDATQMIEKDHRKVEGLLAKFRSTQDPKIAEQICSELEAHAGAEEHAAYPKFAEKDPELKKPVDEGEKEHGKARQLIGRIKQTSDADHLTDLVGARAGDQSPVHEQETGMLPKARDAIDARELEQPGGGLQKPPSPSDIAVVPHAQGRHSSRRTTSKTVNSEEPCA